MTKSKNLKVFIQEYKKAHTAFNVATSKVSKYLIVGSVAKSIIADLVNALPSPKTEADHLFLKAFNLYLGETKYQDLTIKALIAKSHALARRKLRSTCKELHGSVPKALLA